MAKPKQGKRKAGEVVTDPRFAKVHTDPRFQIFPSKQRKVVIDDRFKGMLTEERFQHRAPVDKRGRKVKLERKNEDLAQYYQLQGEDEDDEEAAAHDAAQQPEKARKQSKKPAAGDGRKSSTAKGAQQPAKQETGGEATSSSSEEEEGEEDEARARWARMRGLAEPEEGSTSDSSEDEGAGPDAADEELERDGMQEEEWGVGALAGNPDEPIPEGDETARLAILDLDWEHVTAVDILAVLRSFLGKGQRIERVTVYPSDYGLAQMAEEAKLGPRAIFAPARPAAAGAGEALAPAGDPDKSEGAESDSDEGPGSEDGQAGPGRGGNAGRDGDDDADEGAEVDQERLRMYERSKLRWYYAVVVCDGMPTAAHLYRECDGLEFEISASRLDLRFVPDGQSFEGRRVRDSAADVPAGYEAPPAFATAALQHTSVKLTWDADDTGRRRALSKRVTAEELREDDFRAYLGSEGESEEEAGAPAPADVERYRQLLLAGGADGGEPAAQQRKGGKDWGAYADEEDDEDEQEAGTGPEVGGTPAHAQQKANGSGRSRGGARRDDVDMEVTFAPGLETLGERLAAKRAPKQAETVWEQYMRRRREKREAAKRQGRRYASSSEDERADGAGGSSDDSEAEGAATAAGDPFFQQEEDPFADPFFQGGDQAAAEQQQGAAGAGPKKEQRRRERAMQKASQREAEVEEARRRAELELLLLDEQGLQRGAQGPAVDKPGTEGTEAANAKAAKPTRKERLRAKKAAKRAERAAASDDEDLGPSAAPRAQAALEDPRFTRLVADPNFALDPTDPRFRAAEGAAELAAEVAKRKSKHRNGAAAVASGLVPKGQAAGAKGAGPARQFADLKAMIASLKIKAARAGKQPKAQLGADPRRKGKTGLGKLEA